MTAPMVPAPAAIVVPAPRRSARMIYVDQELELAAIAERNGYPFTAERHFDNAMKEDPE